MYGAEPLDPTQLLKDAKLKSMTRCTNVAEARLFHVERFLDNSEGKYLEKIVSPSQTVTTSSTSNIHSPFSI
ncbi:hypothetical protein WR25_14291 [Diploscapter pachys]|uniref:Uncharacterized protein n=1 Tax=Diploscapter pachys TaxID=2018661 RepID=A0A2A2KGM3_9BILA|nr:hypothetical protein WR25_14291 [Diploscapter pachys]